MTDPSQPGVPAVHSDAARRENAKCPIEPPCLFPLEVFPADVATYIAASADSARVPASMVAVPFLGFAGATIGNQLCVNIGNGWYEYPGLWVALIAPTGAGKTPAVSWARVPLDYLQDEAWVKWKGKRPLERLFANDATIESLADDLGHNPGLVIIRDELYGLINTMSQFHSGKSTSFQPWLSLWSSEPLSISRRNNGHIYVWTPVVSICGGIQPQLWSHFARKQMDGALERFIPVVVGVSREYWNESLALNAEPPDIPGVIARFRKLRSIAPRGLTVSRSKEAGLVWAAWFNGNLDRSLAASVLHAGYYQKLPSQVARTALILHALWHPNSPENPISAETMRFATTLGEFYRTHIHRSLAILGQPRQVSSSRPSLGERIFQLLAEHVDDDGWMTRSVLHGTLGKPARSELQEILDSLVEGRCIDRRKQRLAHSKRPIESYRLCCREG